MHIDNFKNNVCVVAIVKQQNFEILRIKESLNDHYYDILYGNDRENNVIKKFEKCCPYSLYHYQDEIKKS